MDKVLLIVCLLGAVAATNFPGNEGIFIKYMKDFNKKYEPTELKQRFQNFEASIERIAMKNAKSKGATYSINKFSDMSTTEFEDTILMKEKIQVQQEKRKKSSEKLLAPKADIKAPATFDWRDKGAVTPVKDQGQCGSCWAFSVTENVESTWIVAGKGNATSVDLAPQQIVDCDTTDGGCNGGDPPTAYEYIISAGGLEPESDYPYTAEDGTCQFNQKEVETKISNWKYATSEYSETTLQQNLVSWGPLSICVDASWWQDYSSGVMTWEECAWVNVLDHCVLLVGYNSTASYPYWLVRNSWGTDWGVSGYIWLQMWEDTCGLTYEATTSVV